jgi:hypothetical protein
MGIGVSIRRGRRSSVVSVASCQLLGGQFVQQRLGLFEVIGVEPLGGAVVDFSKHHVRLIVMPRVVQ